jgi:hypothetical protein
MIVRNQRTGLPDEPTGFRMASQHSRFGIDESQRCGQPDKGMQGSSAARLDTSDPTPLT